MDNYRVTPSIESSDEYIQARNDLIKAKISFEKLTDEETFSLIREFVGAEAAYYFMRVMQSNRR